MSKRLKHNALLDCELLREVYINLLDAKEPKFNLSSNVSKKNIEKIMNITKKLLKFQRTEINMHKEFLKKELKKNFIEYASYYNFSKSTLSLILTSLNPEFSNNLTNIDPVLDIFERELYQIIFRFHFFNLSSVNSIIVAKTILVSIFSKSFLIGAKFNVANISIMFCLI